MDRCLTIRPIIGISSCLLGNKVRYSGGHKLDEWISIDLNREVDFHVVCPEVEMGLGIPRSPVQLRRIGQELRMISSDNNIDHTDNALATSERIISRLPQLSGFILMSKSPSCGHERVKIHNSNGELLHDPLGQGIFASELKKTYPFLPIIDSGRFKDLAHRENYLRIIFTYHRFLNIDFNLSKFKEFHQRHKFIFMEYQQDEIRALGKLVALTTKENFAENYLQYLDQMMGILEILPLKKNRIILLMHVFRFFKDDFEKVDKINFLKIIDDYHNELIPYLVPLKLLAFFASKYRKDYLLKQYLFNPYPHGLLKI